MPAEKYQTALLDAVYEQAGVAADSVAYRRGARDGDPRSAIPSRPRRSAPFSAARGAAPLPIGSIKSNIGHTGAGLGACRTA